MPELPEVETTVRGIRPLRHSKKVGAPGTPTFRLNIDYGVQGKY